MASRNPDVLRSKRSTGGLIIQNRNPETETFSGRDVDAIVAESRGHFMALFLMMAIVSVDGLVSFLILQKSGGDSLQQTTGPDGTKAAIGLDFTNNHG